MLQLLSGEDRRSVTGIAEVVAMVELDPEAKSELRDCFEVENPLVVMRAMDAVLKLVKKNGSDADWNPIVLQDWTGFELWELRLCQAQLLGLLNFSDQEKEVARRRLRALIDNPSEKFVWAWSIDSFGLLAKGNEALEREAWTHIEEGMESGFASVVARLKKTAQLLASVPK